MSKGREAASGALALQKNALRISSGATAPAAVVLLAATLFPLHASQLTDTQLEFFESRIRPILAQECYECHSEATKAKGGLLLDSRAGWQKGGKTGAIIEAGKPEASLLIHSLTHELADLKMPKNGAKLDPQILDDFRQWITMGAPDPRDAPPSSEQLAEDTDWTAVSARRAQWWSFQPIKNPDPPEISGATHPVDRFIRAKLFEKGLAPSPPADPRVLLRRLYFNLIGLPPTPSDTASFMDTWKTDPDEATSGLVDRLLANPGFGEKWARHWMDWTRYADTHGSEGDPTIPHAWRYRDYLVRALNADVPLDQLVVEHLAGDLIENERPRINAEMKLNESALGLGHLRMVFHGFSPTDALDERVRFTDDQINTVTKAFLGLTVSCARCHDHKFDAISQADYYALYGIFTNALPATIAVDAPGVLETHREELTTLKARIRKGLSAHWIASLPSTTAEWEARAGSPGVKDSGAVPGLLTRLADTKQNQAALKTVWDEAVARISKSRSEEDRFDATVQRRWDLSDHAHFATWSRYGEGVKDTAPAPAGDFIPAPAGASGDPVVAGIVPSGVYSHLISSRHRAVLASAPFVLDAEYDLFVRISGEGGSFRYAVQHYPRSGTIYPVSNLNGGKWRWEKEDLAYWKGDSLHFELATAADAPILVKEMDRSWFGIREAMLVPKGSPAPEHGDDESLYALFTSGSPVPQDLDEAFNWISATLRTTLSAWGKGDSSLTNAQAILLDELLAAGWLPNSSDSMPGDLTELVNRYRKLEAEIPSPTRAPGVFERPGADQALYERGDHKQPAATVPRRFLEAIDATPYKTAGTGRLEFARDLVAEKNPFTTRVLVNRVWYHLFGDGIVPTVDNFGRLGETPSHPELLDFLSARFRGGQAWSLKALVRDLVLSETWQQSSGPPPEALTKDPGNRWLSSYPLRRLEAEAIRDSLLALSGKLDLATSGPPVSGDQPRRSIYVRVKRNDLDPFLSTFDFPVPASSVGKRDVTNVPAQSLTLLNDPLLDTRARQWSTVIKTALPSDADDEARIRHLFEMAMTRPPTTAELTGAKDFLAAIDYEHRSNAERFTEITARLENQIASRDGIIEPIRTRLESERAAAFAKEKGGPAPKAVLDPLAHWDFEKDAKDLVGGLDLSLEGTAKLEKGALVVDETGFARSSRLPFDLAEKTLEATVELATLDQAGGGVISVQKENGGVFDSIVFAERRKHEWLAGSNGFVRTLDFNGPVETVAAKEAVHLVLTYAGDGRIRAFRNGMAWGETIRKADLVTYEKGEGEILFGLRHGTAATGNKTLRGRILEARLYGRALDESEVHAAFFGGPVPVTREDIVSALDDTRRDELTKLEAFIAAHESEAAELRRLGSDTPLEDRRWAELAHAILNLKEFIYLR